MAAADDEKRRNNGSKGLLELLIFAAALATGTASSILSKVMYNATDASGEQHFDKPIAQTFCMFVAMLMGMPIHWLVVWGRIPFPGYHGNNSNGMNDTETDDDDSALLEARHQRQQNRNKPPPSPIVVVKDYDATPRMHSHKLHHPPPRSGEQESLLPTHYNHQGRHDDDDGNSENNSNMDHYIQGYNHPFGMPTVPFKTYMQLLVPAFFDCTSTALFMVGLLFLDVSIYQLLRGSGIIFVGLLRQYALKEHLYQYQWVGLWWNVVSALLVGATALLDSTSSSSSSSDNNIARVAIGVTMMMSGTLLQAMEFVLEEKFMVADEVKVPPLLFFGMKGFWGVLLTLFLLYPISYYVPGHDNGSFETFWTGWDMVRTTPYIRLLVIIYCVVIFCFNLFCVLVTFLLSSIWHAILDNFRPLTVWCTDLFIFYVLSAGQEKEAQRLGEAWTPWSWLQLVGMVVLIYGTAIYNAPDSGSVRLEGAWYALGMDYSHEYKEIEYERDAQHRFSMGSYPSLQGFLKVSGGASVASFGGGDSIRFGQRVNTMQPAKSPRMYAPRNATTSNSNASHSNNVLYYNNYDSVDLIRPQHSM